MYPMSISAPVTRTVRIGTPDRHSRSLRVIHSGPVCPRSASVCSTREATYMLLMAHVNVEKTNIALKKCAAAGMPASTTAIMKTERALIDCAPPLMKGWSVGITKEAMRTAKA